MRAASGSDPTIYLMGPFFCEVIQLIRSEIVIFRKLLEFSKQILLISDAVCLMISI